MGQLDTLISVACKTECWIPQLVLIYLQIRDPLYAICPIEVTHQPGWSTLGSIRIVNLENMVLHFRSLPPPPIKKEGISDDNMKFKTKFLE